MVETMAADLACETCLTNTIHSFYRTNIARIGRGATDADGRLLAPTPVERLTAVTDEHYAVAEHLYKCPLCATVRRYGFDSVDAGELAEAKSSIAA